MSMYSNSYSKIIMDKEEQTNSNIFSHLKELRTRILKSLVAVVFFIALTAYFADDILNEIILKPSKNANLELLNISVFGQPIFYFKIIFGSALILAFPFIINQIWLFVKPALYEKEIKWTRRLTFFTTICFFSGILFSYFVLVPGMLQFASAFGNELIKNQIDINNYLSFLILINLAMGILFELPVAVFILTKIGILSPQLLMKYWKYSVVFILILAAVITPTPDPLSQLIFAFPLFILYLISIYISKLAVNKQKL